MLGETSSLALLALLVLGAGGQANALDNGLQLTPPMGWLSWERFTCTTDCAAYPNDCINSKLYRSMADRLVADGYAQLGYEYVNIDDCWSERQRDPQGDLLGDRARFPEGIEALAGYVHGKSLKLGIYGDCGTATCDGYPAQLKSESDLEDNHFERDANLFARWQVDSFKFDGCHLEASKAESICPKMAEAVAASKRPIAIMCEWPFYMLRELYNEQHLNQDGQSGDKLWPNFELAARACNSWRYFEDVEDSWLSILNIVDFSVRIQTAIVRYHGPGHWFDPDQLVIGNFALSHDQARAQMALWSIWSAPLFMGNDLRDIAPDMAAILKNKNLIAVDQDQLGVFGLMVKQSADGKQQAFAKPVEPIKDGCPSFVILYLNRETLGNSRDVSFSLRDLISGLPISLAAQRYEKLYPPGEALKSPGGEFVADKCKRMLKLAMSKEPGETASTLLNKPINKAPVEAIEERQVHFNVYDLFGDGPTSRTLPLNGNVTLRVNPSGVRMIKLTLASNQEA